MARKSHHMPLSGGDRKALTKELGKTPGISAKFLTYLLTTRNSAMIAAWLVAVKVAHLSITRAGIVEQIQRRVDRRNCSMSARVRSRIPF